MKYLIVNADDFGYAKGVNQGIIEAHKKGVVTSTSLMVNGKAVRDGVKLAGQNPKLGLGLHFQIEDNDLEILWQSKRLVAAVLIDKTKREFLSQVETFRKLIGKIPDHIDSHHHVHKMPRISPFIRSWCKDNGVPFRGQIKFIDSFFGMPSDRTITTKNLIRILQNLPDGTFELMCHPAFVTPDLKSSYSYQRELELKTLISPIIKKTIKDLNFKLINWQEL